MPDPAATQILGSAPGLRLHDTRTGSVLATGTSGEARLYVCGITPYDATHLGHAATYVTFDLVVRAWRAAGRPVRYVQNVTDVDDPLLERAAATGQDWADLAARETELFRDDMVALSVLPPDVYAGAVESIPEILDLIGALRGAGAVYDVAGDLYFSVEADPRFGSVSGLDRDSMLALFAERGGDPDRRGKRDPLDCLVWQRTSDREPGWPSPYGRGRPGWHVECAAIARTHLGEAFDLQGGGSDLVFPHHEMSASEAHAVAPGVPFARAYAHQGMVGYGGEKMSKSRGNLVLVSRLRADGVDPRVIRLALLDRHYRTDWEWDDDQLTEAAKRLDRWTAAMERSPAGGEATARAVRAACADDLDAPRALAAVDAWADSDADPDSGSGDLVAATVEASLGISGRRYGA